MAIKSWMGGILVVHRILSQRLLAWSLQSLIRLKEFVKLKLYSSDYFFCSRMVIMSSGRPCLMWHHPLLYATNLHTCCLRRCHVKICSRIRLQRFVSFQISWFENLHSIRSLELKMGHLIMTRLILWTNRRFCLEGLLSRLVFVVLEIRDTYDIWSPDPMFFSVATICVPAFPFFGEASSQVEERRGGDSCEEGAEAWYVFGVQISWKGLKYRFVSHFQTLLNLNRTEARFRFQSGVGEFQAAAYQMKFVLWFKTCAVFHFQWVCVKMGWFQNA